MINLPQWSHEEIVKSLKEFSKIYTDRPILSNDGGMKAPHMFAVWFIVKKLSPDYVVESGVWKGQGTWLLEQACPDAKLISIDLDLSNRVYISKKAVYSDKDFSENDWSKITDQSLVFFDDHQNAYKRLQQCKWFGFKNIIFEDNYPIFQGDFYSLKKAFAGVGFNPQYSMVKHNVLTPKSRIKNVLANIIGINPISITPQYDSFVVQPNKIDSIFLKKNINVYYEFPPIFKTERTRWGDSWNNKNYPTPKPLLKKIDRKLYKIFFEEAMSYNWICYVKLN